MEIFNKDDLQYSYYWSENYDDPVTIHREKEMDRQNGDQMLVYFNQFLKLHGLFSLSSINRLEKLVYDYMPEHINTPAEINTWLGQNWNGHFH